MSTTIEIRARDPDGSARESESRPDRVSVTVKPRYGDDKAAFAAKARLCRPHPLPEFNEVS
jgi:hypothetical protein